MINDQVARILQSQPESLISAIYTNNQELAHLEALLDQRGKQVASLQHILKSEVSLVGKVVSARGEIADCQERISLVGKELGELKNYAKEQIQKTYGELMAEIAKVFKEFCIDKKQREEEIGELKAQIQRLNDEIKIRAQDILHIDHIDHEASSDEQMRGRHSRIPMLQTGGYTLGNEELKQLFSPVSEQTLSISDIKTLKEQNFQLPANKALKQGRGEAFYEKGYVYRGCFKNGQRHGFGELSCKNQLVYRGDWKRDVFWGKGTLKLRQVTTIYQNAILYMGNFQNGDFHGLGVLEFQDESRFTTEFSKGRVVSPGLLNKDQYMSILQYQSNTSLDLLPLCK